MNEDGLREHLRDALLGAGQTVAVDACEREDIDVIMVSQKAFGCSMTDILTLGTLVKYAGVNGKKVIVMSQALSNEDDEEEDL